MTGWPRKFMAKIKLVAGEPVEANDVSAALLQEKVQQLKEMA